MTKEEEIQDLKEDLAKYKEIYEKLLTDLEDDEVEIIQDMIIEKIEAIDQDLLALGVEEGWDNPN